MFLIFGENHTKPNEIIRINNYIRKHKPDFVLHELLYSDKVSNRKIAKSRLDKCNDGYLCDPKLNKDIYKLAFELDIPFIGIDLDENYSNLSLKQQFLLREKHMISIINKYKNKGNIIVVIGDSHLRQNKNKILGDPLIYNTFKNEATVIRSGKIK